jgi:acetoin utilization protein AcuB
MRVGEVMTTSLVTVGLDESLEVVREIFARAKFHHLLVVDSGKLVGIVSDRDLLRALSPNLGTLAESVKDAATLHKRVHQVMTRKLITLPADAPLTDAIDLFCNRGISGIPVLDDQQRPVGIVSWRDLLKAMGALLNAEVRR